MLTRSQAVHLHKLILMAKHLFQQLHRQATRDQPTIMIVVVTVNASITPILILVILARTVAQYLQSFFKNLQHRGSVPHQLLQIPSTAWHRVINDQVGLSRLRVAGHAYIGGNAQMAHHTMKATHETQLQRRHEAVHGFRNF